MKVIVCGAGQVGFHIAKHLADQSNDVTVIDRSPDLVRKISDSLDVQGLVGHASDPAMLAQAAAKDADLIVAATQSDEVNMVACQVAHSIFNIPTKIARIRNQTYLKDKWADLFARTAMPIDVIISPEVEVAEALTRRLELPGAFNMLPFVDDTVRVVGLRLEENCPVVDTPLRQLTELFPNLRTTVMAVIRGDRVFVPTGRDQLQVDDNIYIAVASETTERTMAVFGHEEKAARRVTIVGGGNIGVYLAQRLEKRHKDLILTLIEIDPDRALKAAEALENTIVINGDALERDIQAEANVADSETIVAVADDDEVNILASLLAKQQGCARAITLMNNPIYGSLVGSLGIDVALDPREITVSSIVQHMRRGRIRGLHSIREGQAEIIEAEVISSSELVGKSIRDLRLHNEVRVGMIVRGGEAITPKSDTSFEAGDRVVVLVLSDYVKKMEQYFSARVDYF